MKNLLRNAVEGLVGIVVTVVVTNAISGQPLAGLTRLKGLYRTFIESSVPAWVFALAFLLALSSLYYSVTHLPRRTAKGRVHFVPDAHNCGWARQSDTRMDLRMGGTFTYEGTGSLTLLKVSLKGTRPLTDPVVQLLGSGRQPLTASQVFLQGHVPAPALIQVYLTPVIGTPGQAVRSTVVFRDIYNRDFAVGPIEFPCLGGR